MTTPMIENEVQIENSPANPVFGWARNGLLIGLGTVAYVQDESKSIFSNLVKRGEQAEQDGRQMWEKWTQPRDEQFEGEEKPTKTTSNPFVNVFKRLAIPSKHDIESLSHDVQDLSRKVSRLQDETSA